MRNGEKIVTAAETYDSLMRIMDLAGRALRELGRIEGKSGLDEHEALRALVLDVSKNIANELPAFQMERDDIDHAETVYSNRVRRASEEVA